MQNSLAPSSTADSYSARGIARKKLIRISSSIVQIALGSTMAPTVSVSPSDFTTMNVGITPPLKNMVNMISPMNTLLPVRFGLESGYAVRMVITG